MIEPTPAEIEAAARAWLVYRDGPMRLWPKRQLRRREFVAGYLAALTASAQVQPAENEAGRAYREGRWCGECRYGAVEDPPCCTQPAPEADEREARWMSEAMQALHAATTITERALRTGIPEGLNGANHDRLIRDGAAILARRSQPAPRTAAEESLRRDVQTLLPGLLSAEWKERWADGSPAQQALRDIQRILGDERGPIR